MPTSPYHRTTGKAPYSFAFVFLNIRVVFVLSARELLPRTLWASSPRARRTREEMRKRWAESLLAGYRSCGYTYGLWIQSIFYVSQNARSYKTMCITIVRNRMTTHILLFFDVFKNILEKKIKASHQQLLMLSNGSSLLQSADSVNVSSQFSFNLSQDNQTFKEIKWTFIQYRCRTIMSWKNLRLKSALSRFECIFCFVLFCFHF